MAATQRAIEQATAFDPRDAGHNFDIDYSAYELIERNLGQLVEIGYLSTAMKLSQELMKRGSSQVEMSDEGLMTHEIERCLKIVPP